SGLITKAGSVFPWNTECVHFGRHFDPYMRFRTSIISSFALCAFVLAAHAQETNEVELLKQQLRQVLQVQEEQRQKIEALTKQLDEMTKKQSAEAERKKLEQQLAAELQTNAPASTPAPATSAPWSPSQPMTVARAGSAYMNISFDTLMDVGGSTAHDPSAQLELGDHDPIKRGFSLRNAEIAVDGAVDPYFKGFGNIVLKLDKNNETEIELEEAYLQTTSLPGNLQ